MTVMQINIPLHWAFYDITMCVCILTLYVKIWCVGSGNLFFNSKNDNSMTEDEKKENFTKESGS